MTSNELRAAPARPVPRAKPNPALAAFLQYLTAERGASAHTVRSYRSDLLDCVAFLDRRGLGTLWSADARVVRLPEAKSAADWERYAARLRADPATASLRLIAVSGHGSDDSLPANMIWNHLCSQMAECFNRLSNDKELTVDARRASFSDRPPILRISASRCWSRKLRSASRSVAVEKSPAIMLTMLARAAPHAVRDMRPPVWLERVPLVTGASHGPAAGTKQDRHKLAKEDYLGTAPADSIHPRRRRGCARRGRRRAASLR